MIRLELFAITSNIVGDITSNQVKCEDRWKHERAVKYELYSDTLCVCRNVPSDDCHGRLRPDFKWPVHSAQTTSNTRARAKRRARITPFNRKEDSYTLRALTAYLATLRAASFDRVSTKTWTLPVDGTNYQRENRRHELGIKNSFPNRCHYARCTRR